MDKTNKRSADSEQTVDTFAVCSNCSRLSYNLKQCDKCGSPLSEDNASMCVSAEPKRTRLESPVAPANGTIPNGNSSSHSTVDGTISPSLTSNAVPVPQALYVNKNTVPALSTQNSEPVIRPQALYVNVNNQVFPLISGASSAVSESSKDTVVTVTAGQGTTNTTAQSQVVSLNSSTPSSSLINSIPVENRGSGVAAATAAAASSTNLGSTTGLTSPGINSTPRLSTAQLLSNTHTTQTPPTNPSNRPPPPLVAAAVATTTSSSSFNTFNLPPPPPYLEPSATMNSDTSGDDSSNVIGELSINADSVAMPATQIRIGTRKFLPASSVTFKEDGVLFALKDFTHAPVLLNARAIIKCKANMYQYPVFFVFLEATCIRQIRNIFGLTIDEFQENSSANLKKCITIFPSIMTSISSRIRNNMVQTIRKIFSQMGSRYPRSGPYLNEISNMETIDMLFDSMSNQRTSSDVIPRGMSPSRSTVPTSTVATANSINQHALQNSANSNMYSTRAPSSVNARLTHSSQPGQGSALFLGSDSPNRMPSASNMIRLHPRDMLQQPSGVQRMTVQQNAAQRTGIPPRQGVPRMVTAVRPSNTTTVTTAQPPGKSTTITAGTTAPLLVVPSDSQKWREMQKDLVEGGVYHVELPSKERKYYLWDGSRLVPCLVQNTEVQLNCIYCRIGSLRAEATNIKVRADEPSGISCTIKSEHTGQVPLSLPLNMISSVTTCFDKNCIMFVSLNHNGWWNVQNTLKLGGDRDPSYNPNSADAPRRKYLVMIFTNVNKDQKDALLGIKHKYGGTQVFMQAPHSVVFKMMGEIMKNICYTQKRSTRDLNFDSPLQDFMALDRAGLPGDDDDDDVIMTSEEVGIKCPYTQQVMKEPVKNNICEHNYEKVAIQEFIVRKKGNAKCPYAGCGNSKPLSMLDLEENKELRDYIRKQNDKT